MRPLAYEEIVRFLASLDGKLRSAEAQLPHRSTSIQRGNYKTQTGPIRNMLRQFLQTPQIEFCDYSSKFLSKKTHSEPMLAYWCDANGGDLTVLAYERNACYWLYRSKIHTKAPTN